MWVGVVILGVVFFVIVVLSCGEMISVLWVVVVVFCIYLIVYCYYSFFIVDKVLGFDVKC